MDLLQNRIRAALNMLEGLRRSGRRTVGALQIRQGDYSFSETLSPEETEAGDWRPFGADDTWGGRDAHFWFRAELRAEAAWQGRQVRARLETGASDLWNTDNPQIMAYVNGTLAGTMDLNHQELILTDSAQEGERFALQFYAYSNSPGRTNFFHLTAAVYEPEVTELYYDLNMAYEAAALLDPEDLERMETFRCLNTCVGLLDTSRPGSQAFLESVCQADRFLKEALYARASGSPVTVHAVGHTHIDVAWKWPLRQTKQKAVRSFRTVLNLMERYPEYKFMSSQPQLYQFVKEEAPKLFEEIRERIRQGRWEAEGAMWLEPDCNLASGESLIRQILYGRQFFEEELGAAPNEVLWLPDVFGYSAALPQIMKKSGLSYFVTTKLGWNEYNQFPYDTFLWKGIDGSQVLTHLITTRDYSSKDQGKKPGFATTYNGLQNPSQIMGTWQRYQNKAVSREVLTCYGYGDGGGGPTEEMLEQSRRLEGGIVRCPQVRQSFVKEFFHSLEQHMDTGALPAWSGELYLEFHRGTYTSAARNKWYNRYCEFLNGDSEFFSVLAKTLCPEFSYPEKALERNWKLLLLNQFHDILPGSAIHEVYEDSWAQYEELIKSGSRMIARAAGRVLESFGGEGLAVFNTLSSPRTSVLRLKNGQLSPEKARRLGLLCQTSSDGSLICLASQVPSKGFAVYRGEREAEEAEPVLQELETDAAGRPLRLATAFYLLEWNRRGELSRIFDRRANRELLKEGQSGNHLVVYEDRPLEFDAWNIDASYREHSWEPEEPEEFCLEENGPVRAVLLIRRRFRDSWIAQRLCLYRHTARIDFETEVDWHQHQMLLRTEFPVDLVCQEADYEIQFGNVKRPVHRNTTWDQARFEVCAHKWMDLSEYGYGAALLNDCKYGCDIHDAVLGLTLIKSGIFPDPQADQGRHRFTYALYPHQGDFRQGGVVQEAYDLNCPLKAFFRPVSGACQNVYGSFLTVREPNVIVETVKKAQKGEDLVIRMYEAWGMRGRVHIALPLLGAFQAEECDCMERRLSENMREGREFVFEIRPYEIKTFRIRPVME